MFISLEFISFTCKIIFTLHTAIDVILLLSVNSVKRKLLFYVFFIFSSAQCNVGYSYHKRKFLFCIIAIKLKDICFNAHTQHTLTNLALKDFYKHQDTYSLLTHKRFLLHNEIHNNDSIYPAIL